jgi:hypothetical protein
MTDTPPPTTAPPTPIPDVSANIRAELARRRITVRAAQEAVQLGATTWDDRMQRPGYWRLDQLQRLADFLEVPLADLVLGR